MCLQWYVFVYASAIGPVACGMREMSAFLSKTRTCSSIACSVQRRRKSEGVDDAFVLALEALANETNTHPTAPNAAPHCTARAHWRV